MHCSPVRSIWHHKVIQNSHLRTRCILESIIREYPVKLCRCLDFECGCWNFRRERLEEPAVVPLGHIVVNSIPTLKVALNSVSGHVWLAFSFTNVFSKWRIYRYPLLLRMNLRRCQYVALVMNKSSATYKYGTTPWRFNMDIACAVNCKLPSPVRTIILL